MSPRDAVLSWVAAQIPDVGRPVLVAVDGGDGAGKTRFADALARILTDAGRTVVRSGIDHFHHPSTYRHALGRTAETVWARSFDVHAVRRELLDPWLSGDSDFRSTWFDVVADQPNLGTRQTVPTNGVLIFDGIFAQREEFAAAWDVVVYLCVADAERIRRVAERDGVPDDPTDPAQRRYLGAQEIYRAACDPVASADIVIDNDDWAAPVVRPSEERSWRRVGADLVRQVRVPVERPDLAAAIDDLLSND